MSAPGPAGTVPGTGADDPAHPDTAPDHTGTGYPDAWSAVLDRLVLGGVRAVFALPGDDLGLLAAARSRDDLRVVLCRHQRNAMFMATGYALFSGRPAACVVGKGPGLANALPGLVEARAAAAPVLLVSGGTATDRVGTGAFQELDQLAAVRPLVGWARRVDRPQRLVEAVDAALLVATNGTPGPVYLELPDDLLDQPVPARPARGAHPAPHIPAGGPQYPATTAEPAETPGPTGTGRPQYPAPDRAALDRAAEVISRARRPVLLVGGGMRHRNPDRRVERLAERLGAALVTTASGRGTVDEDHPLCCGLAGLYTPAPVRPLWAETDLVIALGTRLEETATFGWEGQPPTVVQVNVTATEIAPRFAGPVVLGDGGAAVAGWLADAAAADRPDRLTGPTDPDRSDWRTRIHRARAATLAAGTEPPVPDDPATRPRVAAVLRTLDRILPPDRILVQENGLQDIWSYVFPYWRCAAPAGSVVPSEQTSLGFGAAAAAGVKLAAGSRPVVAFVGDGAFDMFHIDLRTVAAQRLAVLYVVLNNGGYGWLHQQERRPPEYPFVSDPVEPVESAGVPRVVVDTAGRLGPALEWAWATCAAGGPVVVDVRVDLADAPPGLDHLDGDFPAGP